MLLMTYLKVSPQSVELREKVVCQECELQEKAIKNAVLRSQVELADRLQELTFSEEYRIWRKELLTRQIRRSNNIEEVIT